MEFNINEFLKLSIYKSDDGETLIHFFEKNYECSCTNDVVIAMSDFRKVLVLLDKYLIE